MKLVAFDLDDTLAPSKSPVDPEMAELLGELVKRVPVCIISGGRFEQFSMQVLAALDSSALDSTGALTDLHLMPTCGTQYFQWSDSAWTQIYSEELTDGQKSAVIEALEAGERDLGFTDPQTWGPKIEDRGSQITFSALGQQAPVDAKKAWDPSGAKKEALREFVAQRVPELEVRSGGSTSVDVTRKGVDKAYGMEKIKAELGLDNADILFVGDRLDSGGNDYPVKAMGISCVAVQEWQQTAIFIRGLIATFDLQRSAATVAESSTG
jgi:HAD superfamily hydrolase (TIGR01484 family)